MIEKMDTLRMLHEMQTTLNALAAVATFLLVLVVAIYWKLSDIHENMKRSAAGPEKVLGQPD